MKLMLRFALRPAAGLRGNLRLGKSVLASCDIAEQYSVYRIWVYR